MKFLTGLLAGIVIGAAGAVLYSVKSGRDLRVALDEVRADFDKRDMDAIGARLEAQFTALTAQLETRIGQVRERASSTPDQVVDLAQSAAADATDAVEAAVVETTPEIEPKA
jgi:gas vesicle protein